MPTIAPLSEQIEHNRDPYRALRRMASVLPDRWFFALRHRMRFGRWPNLDNPSSFNEWLLNMILTRDQADLRTEIADKLKMRDYVTEIVGPQYLSQVLQRADSFDQLDWNRLPERFVLKSNHASRHFVLVDKSNSDKDRLRRLTNEWLKENYYRVGREYVYKAIEPQIYAEEMFVRSDGQLPYDVKAHVFHGRLRFFRINENKLGKGYHEIFYDRHWKRVPFLTACYEADDEEKRSGVPYEWPKPPLIDEMRHVAECLGKQFKFIRVDFCDLGDRFIITELTNFPAGGNDYYEPSSFDLLIGRLLAAKDSMSEQEAKELDQIFP